MAASTTFLLRATVQRTLKHLSPRNNNLSVRSLKSTTAVNSSRIPEPTWSVNDLHLSANSTEITDEELDVLASRCLLHIPDDERPKLKQELGKMHNFISLVQQAKFDDAVILTEEDMYDAPRGFGKEGMRVRHEQEELDAWKDKVEKDAKLIMSHLKGDEGGCKMVPRHGDKEGRNGETQPSYYFSIVTCNEKE